MTHHPERELDQWAAQWAVQAMARWTLTVAIGLGVLIVLGGDARFSEPSYAAALRYPYAPESWGVILLLIGTAGLVTSLWGWLRPTAVALFLVAAWCLFFGFSFASTAADNPHAGTTGAPIYGFALVTSILLAVVHWKSAASR